MATLVEQWEAMKARGHEPRVFCRDDGSWWQDDAKIPVNLAAACLTMGQLEAIRKSGSAGAVDALHAWFYMDENAYTPFKIYCDEFPVDESEHVSPADELAEADKREKDLRAVVERQEKELRALAEMAMQSHGSGWWNEYAEAARKAGDAT